MFPSQENHARDTNCKANKDCNSKAIEDCNDYDWFSRDGYKALEDKQLCLDRAAAATTAPAAASWFGPTRAGARAAARTRAM